MQGRKWDKIGLGADRTDAGRIERVAPGRIAIKQAVGGSRATPPSAPRQAA